MSDDPRRDADTAPQHPPIFRPPPPPPRASGAARPAPTVEPDPQPESAARRESYEKLPTLPTDVTAPLVEPAGDTVPLVMWAPVTTTEKPREGLAGFALALSIVALVASFFVGWGLPVAFVGIIVAIVAMRRPAESRRTAAWALALGITAFVYSAGWLLWTAGQLGYLG